MGGASALPTPHDALFHSTFGHPDNAAQLLRSKLPAPLATAIDWRTLARCDTKLTEGSDDGIYADLLFTVEIAGSPAFLFVLLEHKSSDDPLTAFQLLRYMVRIWERHRHEHPISSRLPPILAFVLHHGDMPWRSGRSLRALIDVEHLPRHIANTVLSWQPDLTFVLDDLARQSEPTLRRRVDSLFAKLSLLCMQYLRGAPRPRGGRAPALARSAEGPPSRP